VYDALIKKNTFWGDWGSLLFGYIFCLNFVGIFPYTLTLTAQLTCTFILALLGLVIVWGHGIYNNKLLILNHFLPTGAPLILAPFIISIELISNFSRLISLPVRLFANITSGHALLKILAGATIGFISILVGLLYMGVTISILVILLISILELIIAFLQAYVFVTLILIYVSEIEH
jgi:F-type H+-transporting ATPase subunit a